MLNKKQIEDLKKRITAKKEQPNILQPIFDALSDLTRFRMFQLFLECKELCVTDVAEILGISVPAASQQLKILDSAGLLEKERMGQMICYKVRRDNQDILSLVDILKGRKFSFKNLLTFYSH